MASLGARSMYIGAGVRRVARIGAKLHENGRLAAGNPAASVLLRRWQRTARFSSQSAAVDGHVEAMVAILGEDAVVIDPEEMAPYNVDWLKNHRGKSKMVLLPASTQQLSRVLAYCSQHDIKVVPQGGNTGLVGGSVPMNDEVIINMKRMNKIRSLDESSGVLVCEAGCILEHLHDWLEDRGFEMPLDLGAKGSCMIGGNVSTNAGGVHFIRNGSMHSNVLGLEVVLADGTVLDLLNMHRKDNTGFPLKHLFVGSEGCLGVITTVALQVRPRPNSKQVCVCVCDTFEQVVELLTRARKQLGEVLSAFEFVDSNGIRALADASPDAVKPLRGVWPDLESKKFFVLIEAASADPNVERLMERMESLLVPLTEQNLVQGVVMASDVNQEKALWHIRECVPVALAQLGCLFKYDLSLPMQQMHQMVTDTADFLQSAIQEDQVINVSLSREIPSSHPAGETETATAAAPSPSQKQLCVTGFGHLGDGNLHLNVLLKGSAANKSDAAETLQIRRQLNKFVYDKCIEMGGSISAEHGIGVQKRPYMQQAHKEATLAVMRGVKQLLDPKDILNPGKVLP